MVLLIMKIAIWMYQNAIFLCKKITKSVMLLPIRKLHMSLARVADISAILPIKGAQNNPLP